MAIRVLLADDHLMLRGGVRALLASCDDIEVVAEAGDGQAALALTAQLSPDVVVMDLRLPDMNGLEAVSRIRAERHGVRVVVMSAYADRVTAAAAMKAGASGVVPKDAAFEELPDAVRAAAAGLTYESPALRQLLSGT